MIIVSNTLWHSNAARTPAYNHKDRTYQTYCPEFITILYCIYYYNISRSMWTLFKKKHKAFKKSIFGRGINYLITVLHITKV